MKTKILTLLLLFAFVGVINADCTLTTDCGAFEYTEDNISASSDGTTITVTSNNQVIDTIACGNSGVSVSCSGSGGDGDNGGDFNICDVVPDFLKPFFGC